jgi:hypothetical protein
MDKLKELKIAAASWRTALKDVGKALAQLCKENEPLAPLCALLRDEYGMPIATATVAMRWARGDFGSDDAAIRLVAMIPHSDLANMAQDTITSVLGVKRHTIYSPDERRIVAKGFNDMTKREVCMNITRIGFVPPPTDVEAVPRVRCCVAAGVDTSDGNVVFVSKGREAIHMRVSHALLEEALSSEAVEA